MVAHSPSTSPNESKSTLNPEVIAIIQNMYQERSSYVLGRLEKMDSVVRSVTMKAIIGTYEAMNTNNEVVTEPLQA